MPGYDEYDEDLGQEQSGPKALRDQLSKLQKELKERDAKIATLEESNSKLATQVKTSTLREAVADAGIDPKFTKFVDLGEAEPTVEAVKKWAEENREIYAFLNKPPTPEGPPVGDDAVDGEGEDEIDPDLAAGVAAAQAAETGGRPAGSNNIQQVLENTDPGTFKTEAELDAFLAKMGAPRGLE